MALSHKNNTINGLSSQNHMKMRYYTCSCFICWKIIIDLGIYGGHFVFALKQFRPRVPKWHPADFCWGHPIVSESIIKHHQYCETRFCQNPLDYFVHIQIKQDWENLLSMGDVWIRWRCIPHQTHDSKVGPWHSIITLDVWLCLIYRFFQN